MNIQHFVQYFPVILLCKEHAVQVAFKRGWGRTPTNPICSLLFCKSVLPALKGQWYSISRMLLSKELVLWQTSLYKLRNTKWFRLWVLLSSWIFILLWLFCWLNCWKVCGFQNSVSITKCKVWISGAFWTVRYFF